MFGAPHALVVALVVAVAACELGDRPPSTDAGADPDVSDCCDWFIVPGFFDHPETCLRKHTAPGECRWLTCLGGLVRYDVCVPEDE